jgi:uncharacterized DUF497 family protein
MELEWDEAKNQQNISKHGIDFQDTQIIFENPVVIKRDARREYGEERWVGLGNLNGTVVALVFTMRKETIRIISVRKASKHERQIYDAKIASFPD